MLLVYLQQKPFVDNKCTKSDKSVCSCIQTHTYYNVYWNLLTLVGFFYKPAVKAHEEVIPGAVVIAAAVSK